ncbi:zinc-ribbon domain-containing protein [[Pseudomonas] boreopolis]|uniref:Zinc-ribbon domain-containing protein n=1 Tax=Xanthomonas boreopolis TaxID=86183 RepID=A0A919KI90_9XANT|nr:hypothetical protein GCM10009090_16270 [[Pseudomonas] boreopolis]
MALIQCSECGRQISDKASACPSCGAPAAVAMRQVASTSIASHVPAPGTSAGAKVLMWIGIPVGVLVLLLAYGNKLANTPDGKARTQSRAEIAVCEQRVRDLKDDPRSTSGTIGFVMDTCAKMRSDYRGKWGREP